METLKRTTDKLTVCIVGNQVPRYSGWKLAHPDGNVSLALSRLETKYRDTADRNLLHAVAYRVSLAGWKPSTAIQRMETQSP